MTSAVDFNTDDDTMVAVAVAFDPTSEAAWVWLFPDTPLRYLWRDTTELEDAVIAARWATRFHAGSTWKFVSEGVAFEQACRWSEQDITLNELFELGWEHLDPHTTLRPWSQAGYTNTAIVDWHRAGITNLDHASALDSVEYPEPFNACDVPRAQQRIDLVAAYTNAGWPPGRLADHVRRHRCYPHLASAAADTPAR